MTLTVLRTEGLPLRALEETILAVHLRALDDNGVPIDLTANVTEPGNSGGASPFVAELYVGPTETPDDAEFVPMAAPIAYRTGESRPVQYRCTLPVGLGGQFGTNVVKGSEVFVWLRWTLGSRSERELLAKAEVR